MALPHRWVLSDGVGIGQAGGVSQVGSQARHMSPLSPEWNSPTNLRGAAEQ